MEQQKVSPKGYMFTRGPGNYKIPGFGDIPVEFNVSLLKDSRNEKAVYSSKVTVICIPKSAVHALEAVHKIKMVHIWKKCFLTAYAIMPLTLYPD